MNLIASTPENDWQSLLKGAISSVDDLLRQVGLSPEQVDLSLEATHAFALRVPQPYLSRIEKGNPHDPLLLQVLPQMAEMISANGYSSDPLEEMDSKPAPGLIHKYKGRVLLILSGACAINCRYCFRRHFPYEDNQLGKAQWQQALAYIQADTSISEVIFSGGDPLATTDQRLARMIADLESIPHIQRLRIHTRLPVVIPQRVTQTLCQMLKDSRLRTVIVLHINHPNEIDRHVSESLQRLRIAGITLLNQAVLLRGINDHAEILKRLSEKLFEDGVLPYYLFLLDRVIGAAHFDINDTKAKQLVKELQSCLPGYLVPRLAREIPGRPSKTLINLA